MVYWFRPVSESRVKLYNGTDWVSAHSDSSGKLYILSAGSTTLSTSGSIDAASNTSGYELSLDTQGKMLVHWHVELGGAGDIKVQVSNDNTNWYDTANSTSLSSSGYWDDWDFIGFRYVKVVVPTSNIDVKILISAK